jgi:hypothetical protein
MNRTTRNMMGTTNHPASEADRQVVIDCFVAGFRYHEGLDIMSYLQPGDEVQLIAEPGNPYDEWAVRIEHRKSRIGYLPRGQNQVVSRLLQQEARVECRITAVDPSAVPWEAVKVQVTTVA